MTPLDLFLYILAAGFGLVLVLVVLALVAGALKGWVSKP